MTRLNAWERACAVFMVCAAMVIASSAQVFNTLVNFDGTDGASPSSTLVQSRDGGLYGTTVNGGLSSSLGTVFRIAQPRVLNTLHEFDGDDGGRPNGTLVQVTNGNFYGITYYGGNEDAGTVFEMTTRGTVTTLYMFCEQPNCADGLGPVGGLTQDEASGNFYGLTEAGGAFDQGTIFKISPRGAFTNIHSFDSTDGSAPLSALVQATDGNFYGTTSGGGANNVGTIFKITPRGAFATLYNFCLRTGCTDGSYPSGALAQAADGNLYGTTEAGGTNNVGTIFKATLDGKVTTLYTFDQIDGSRPAGGVLPSTDGNFYGTTDQGGDLTCNAPHGCGTLFQLTPGGNLATLHQFERSDGNQLISGLAQDTNGIFYGTTYVGGNNDDCPEGCGTIFSLSMGLTPFVELAPAAGEIGQIGGILGQGFTGTTSVSLNGIPAVFTVVSDTFIRATVPAGATTGYVTVVTPTGTLTSNVPFQVIP
jgi:uncharacterized repeat protein (TIGR03803 family)